MTEVTWKDSGIESVADMKGKKVGVWCCGNEFELFAALTKNNIDPKNKDEVTIVNQPFDMSLFVSKQVDAGRGDDLQRARTGARAEEPGDG
jgi:NitT/TauT family transport system substrate-binding protein